MPSPSVDAKYYDRLLKIRLNVIYYRKAKNLSQYELAEKAGVHRSTIAAIESSDKNYGISLNTIFRIADALEIPEKYLFDYRDNQE